MKKFSCSLAVLGLSLAVVWPVNATDEKYVMPIAAALETSAAKRKLDGSVKFFFGKGAKTPEALQRVGGDMVRARQKNSSGVREDVCNAAFWRSLATLSTRAKRLGANALVNIVSSFGDHPEFSSATEFECYQGSRITSVAFKADFVKIGDK